MMLLLILNIAIAQQATIEQKIDIAKQQTQSDIIKEHVKTRADIKQFYQQEKTNLMY